MILNFSWCLSSAVSCAVLNKGAGLPLPGLASPYRKPQSKLTRCALVSGLALSVIASRCHLSQRERPWQSAKFLGLYFTPCCRKGSRRRCAQTSRLCQGLPLWGSWQSRQALTERARTAEAAQGVGLAGACGGRGRARWRGDFASPLFYHFLKKISKSS